MNSNISDIHKNQSNDWIQLVKDDIPQGFYYYFLSGIDFDLHGNGGLKCLNFIGTLQKAIETSVALIICGLSIFCTGYSTSTNNNR